MGKIELNGNCYDIDLVVFDKDGLMFESKHFWKELVRSRVGSMLQILKEENIEPDFVDDWLRFFDVSFEKKDGEYIITDVYSLGIFACASIPEEIALLGGFIKEHAHLPWLQSRELGIRVFYNSDRYFDLARSLKPQKGFPDIFVRLRAAGIPYGIATSDTYERSEASVNMYDDFSAMQFTVSPIDVKRGKPFPDMLYLIQERTGVPVEKMLMIGDSLVDVKMAKAAGAVGLGIPESEEMRQEMLEYATEIVDSLEDIHIL